VWLLALAWVAVRAWQVGWMKPYWSDVFLYQQQFLDVFVRGKTPYVETFVPYPPLALAPLAVLRLFGPVSGHAFFIGFRSLMLVAEIVTYLLVFRLVTSLDLGRAKAWAAVGLCALGFSLQPHLLLDRLDVVVCAFVVGGAVLSVRGRSAGAGVTALLGAVFKVIPGLFALGLAVVKRSRSELVAVGVAGAAAIGVIVLLDVTLWPKLLSTLREHELRGVQVESAWASLLLAGPLLFDALVPEMVEVAYGAAHLRSDLVPGAVLVLSKVAGFSGAALAWWRVAKATSEGRLSSAESVAFTLAFTWLGAVAFQRVLSTQYFLWGTAACALLFTLRPRLVASWLVLLLLTYAAFDLNYPDTPADWPRFLAWTSLRNVVLVVFAVLVVRRFRATLESGNPEKQARS